MTPFDSSVAGSLFWLGIGVLAGQTLFHLLWYHGHNHVERSLQRGMQAAPRFRVEVTLFACALFLGAALTC